jgi:hypothetical protein
VLLIIGALLLGILLAALDHTIVAMALPAIGGDLHGLSHPSWVVTAPSPAVAACGGVLASQMPSTCLPPSASMPTAMWADLFCTTWLSRDLDDDRVQEHPGVGGVQWPGLPGPHVLHHRLGDPRDGLGRQHGAVDLLQVVGDVPDAHAVRVQADDHVVQAAGDPPGPLGHQHRLEAARPVPRHR